MIVRTNSVDADGNRIFRGDFLSEEPDPFHSKPKYMVVRVSKQWFIRTLGKGAQIVAPLTEVADKLYVCFNIGAFKSDTSTSNLFSKSSLNRGGKKAWRD